MKIDTLNSIIAAFEVASNDPTRPTINGVRLERDGSRVKIIATNGHMMSIKYVEDDSLVTLIPSPLFIDRERLALLKVIRRESKRLDAIESVFEGDQLTLKFGGDSLGIARLSDTFPEYGAVLPKGDIVHSVTVNPELLVSVLEALKDDPRRLGVKLLFRESGPIEVRVDATETMGVVMPMRTL